MLFTSELNKLAWKIKKSLNISWGASLRMAIKLGEVSVDPLVHGTWSWKLQSLVAGHFWGLHKAYSEIGDTGRSVAMCRVSKILYGMLEHDEPVRFYSLIRMKGVKESTASEIVEFYRGLLIDQVTPRSAQLMKIAPIYAQKVAQCRTRS